MGYAWLGSGHVVALDGGGGRFFRSLNLDCLLGLCVLGWFGGETGA